jgi:hypothetical protein
MPAHVADDGDHAHGPDHVDVVEVAGHEPRARLVDLADLEAGEVGELLRGEAVGPATGGELLLGQHLLGPPLEGGPLLEQVRLTREPAPVGQGHDDGDGDQEPGQVEPEVAGEGADQGADPGDGVEEGVVDLLAVGRARQVGRAGAPVAAHAADPAPRPLEPEGGAAPDNGTGETPGGDHQENRVLESH